MNLTEQINIRVDKDLKLSNQTTINAIKDSENGKLTNISSKDFDKLLGL